MKRPQHEEYLFWPLLLLHARLLKRRREILAAIPGGSWRDDENEWSIRS